ncbi:O-antigen ligase family protein [Bacillus mycoides]|nr:MULTISPECIES: O-antigen ligase family protein [Bacillus cereus group]MCQ6568742.1 O-antigen ligase family protein [Bacillus mycoides]MDM5431025.1 O-antigen ligase family protein [Bacillus mycoides]MED1406874.1 O-antigen ligase family protein [Bacillus mycoides]
MFTSEHERTLKFFSFFILIILIGLLSQKIVWSSIFILLCVLPIMLFGFIKNPFLVLGLLLPLESIYIIPIGVTKVVKIIVLIAFMITILYKYSNRLKDITKYQLSGYSYVMVLFSLLGIFSSLLSDSIFQSGLKVFQYILIFLCYYILLQIKFNKQEIKGICNYFILGIVLSSFIGLLQKFTNIPWLWSESVIHSATGIGRITAFFNNTNGYGGYLDIGLVIILGNLLLAKNEIKSILLQSLMLLLLFVNLVLTDSEGSIISFAISTLVILLYKIIDARKVFLVALPGILLILLLSFNVIDSDFSQSLINRLVEQGRWTLWEGAIRIFLDNPYYGIGFYQFPEVLKEYGIYSIYGSAWPHPHNLFLDLIVTVGILGSVVFIMLLACIIKHMFVMKKNVWVNNHFKLISLAIIIGAFIHDLIDGGFLWGTSSCATLLWIIVGVVEE